MYKNYRTNKSAMSSSAIVDGEELVTRDLAAKSSVDGPCTLVRTVMNGPIYGNSHLKLNDERIAFPLNKGIIHVLQ